MSTRSSAAETGASASQPPSSDRVSYRFSSQVNEDDGSEEVTPTWGVQFCHRPSRYHLQGRAKCWESAFAQLELTDVRQPPDQPTPNGMHDDPVSAGGKGAGGTDEPIRSLPGTAWRNLFATVNQCHMRLYEARVGTKPTHLQTYVDEDPEEIFYCVAWAFNYANDGAWSVLVAGRKGIIRAININSKRVTRSLIGHGEAVNDIKVHPRDPALVLSASKDESLRLWNLRTGSSIAVFAGLKGHRGEVVSVDFNHPGDRFASCGIDNSIRIWDIAGDDMVIQSIQKSHEDADRAEADVDVDEGDTKKPKGKRGSVPIRQFPIFMTRKVHKHYVDCVMWVGDLLASKSVHNLLYLWEPTCDRESLAQPATAFTLLENYALEDCSIWFIRFAVDRYCRMIACGNQEVRLTGSNRLVFWRLF